MWVKAIEACLIVESDIELPVLFYHICHTQIDTLQQAPQTKIKPSIFNNRSSDASVLWLSKVTVKVVSVRFVRRHNHLFIVLILLVEETHQDYSSLFYVMFIIITIMVRLGS